MPEQYQDQWVQGAVASPGVRDCAGRYDLIRPILDQYTRPITILDIGANLGYFSLRIAEDYDATAVAAEGPAYTADLAANLAANNQPRVLGLAHRLTVSDLQLLAACEHFDIVLALSVAHHLDRPRAAIPALRALGDHLILELANEPNACGNPTALTMPADADILGYGPSHLGGPGRPIGVCRTPKTALTLAYIGTPERDCDIRVDSRYDSKTVSYATRAETRPWRRGINLRTFRHFGGHAPAPGDIRRLVADARDRWDGPHGDIAEHNVVLAGDEAHLIDGEDPRRERYDDNNQFVKMMATL